MEMSLFVYLEQMSQRKCHVRHKTKILSYKPYLVPVHMEKLYAITQPPPRPVLGGLPQASDRGWPPYPVAKQGLQMCHLQDPELEMHLISWCPLYYVINVGYYYIYLDLRSSLFTFFWDHD